MIFKNTAIILMLVSLISLSACSASVNQEQFDQRILSYTKFKENMSSKFGSEDIVLSCFVIDDENVNSDEIIIDIYPKEDDYYVYISKDEFVVPNFEKLDQDNLLKGNITDLRLTEEGLYNIASVPTQSLIDGNYVNDDNTYVSHEELKFGYHYVVSFTTYDKLVKIYG
ncbi:MAG: hypothetical protein ACI4WM_01250 [Erysipelotrichaceae bacterium]